MQFNRKFHRTVRFWFAVAFWSGLAGAAVALPAFMDLLPPVWFLLICVGVSIALAVGRIAHRPGAE